MTPPSMPSTSAIIINILCTLHTGLHWRDGIGKVERSLFYVGNHDDSGSIMSFSRDRSTRRESISQTDTACDCEQRKTGVKEEREKERWRKSLRREEGAERLCVDSVVCYCRQSQLA
jgi:hypothetical protein